MSQRVVTADVNTNIPGAYPSVKVKSNPVGLGSSGIVVIIGEAEGGESYQTVDLKTNSYSPDQFAKVQAKYVGGQIVDAFKAFTAPSNDTDITGTASRIFIVKTNQSTKASALIDTDYGTLRDQNFGLSGNKYKFVNTATASEAAPEKSGNAVATFGSILNGLTFAVRLNGGISSTVTLSATSADHSSATLLASEISAQLPAGMTCSVGAIANSIKFTVAVDTSAFRKGWGKSFELIAPVPADLATLGHAAGITVSSQETAIELSISRSDTGLSETLAVKATIALEVGYAGTSATMTIDKAAKTLTTTVVGGAGSSLSIDLTQYRTMADLAAFIASKTGYSAASSAAAQQSSPTQLDSVLTIGICSAAQKPGRVKNAAATFQKVIATSRGVEFVPAAQAGLPAPTAAIFLSGGARGATAAADIVAIVNQLAGIQCNIIVPLFSRDSSADIAEGLTSSASTYTIDAINAAIKSHCIQYSTPKLKRNRMCVLSYWGTYADTKVKSQSLASFRSLLAFQKSTQENSNGIITNFLPWYAACVAAGMQAGGFYKAIVNKAANVISFQDPVGFDSGSPGDVEDALEAGLLMLSADTARIYWVSDQTTYGVDTNFVYNSMQAVYTSDILALDLADAFQKAFVGRSLSDVDAATALSFIEQKMSGYKKIKLIATSDDAPLGWKNPKVTISGPEMDVSVEVKLATAIYFVPLNISISQVQQTA